MNKEELIDKKRPKMYVNTKSSNNGNAQVEGEAAWKIREVEMQTTAILEEQRLNILKETAYELGMQENKAANAVQKCGTTTGINNIWSYRVGVLTSEIHKAANHVPFAEITRSRRSSSSSTPFYEARSSKFKKSRVVCSRFA